jgi:predicted Zn-dependent protease
MKQAAHARWAEARAGVMVKLATDQLDAGRLDEAATTAERATATSPRSAAAHVLQARIAIERDQLPAAAASLDLALTLPADPATLASASHLRGVVAERWGETDEAVRLFEQAAQLEPKQHGHVVALAEALVAADRVDDATQHLEAVAESARGDAAIFDTLGQVYAAAGRSDEAAAAFAKATLYAGHDPELAERHALALVEAGRAEEALATLHRLGQADDADRMSLQMALGEAHLAADDEVAALRAFQRATRLAPDSRPAWIGVAKASMARGDFGTAESALQRLDEDDADVQMLRALSLHLRGRSLAALAVLDGVDGATAGQLRRVASAGVLASLDDGLIE